MSNLETLKPVTKNFQRVSQADSKAEVLLPVQLDGSRHYLRRRFPCQGAQVVEMTGQYCLLILPDGLRIPVKMGYGDLTGMLDSGMRTVDLKDVTGPAAVGAPRLKQTTMGGETFFKIENHDRFLIHAVITHYNGSEKGRMAFSFYSDEIISTNGPGELNDNWTYITLKDRKPFSDQAGFCVPFDREAFRKKLDDANSRGVRELYLDTEVRQKMKDVKPGW